MTGSRAHPATPLSLAVAVVLAAATARADATDKGMAEALFRAGKELVAAGRVADACPKFAESHRLDPKPGSILNLASCHEQEGRTATAWAEYGEAAAFAARARQVDREKFAREKVDELEKLLSYVVFSFPDGQDVELTIGDRVLRRAAAGTRLPLDPGDHAVSASAPGRAAWSSTLVVPPGPAVRDFAIPALADAPSAAPAPPPNATQRALGWVGVGAGAVTIGFGAFFGVKAFAERSDVDDNCVGSRCNASGIAANERTMESATLSTIGFVAGGALLVTGIVLLVTSPRTSGGGAGTSRRGITAGGGAGVFSATW